MTDLVFAVDIGGTKMAAGLVDRSGALVERAMLPTRRTRWAGGERRRRRRWRRWLL